MSARLFVEGFEADTLGDIDVEFTFSVADISDIERRNTSFSKTLTLPSTSRNQQLFGNIFDISVSNDIIGGPNIGQNFNPAKQAQSQILLDNVKIFDGVLRLSKINNKEGEITYEVNMFGRLRDILHELGDFTLADLDFDDYNHTWNQANIEASWDRIEYVKGAQNYVYPLVDYGYSVDMEVFPIGNFKPAVFVSEILKRIFDFAQFQIVSPIFDNFYFRKSILVTAEKTITRLVSTLLNQSNTLNIDDVTTDATYSHFLDFSNIEASGFTINPAATRFTWNKAQTLNTGLNFVGSVNFTALSAPRNNVFTLRVLRNSIEIFYDSFNVNTTFVGQSISWDINISGGIVLEENAFFEVELTGEIAGGGGFGSDLQTRVSIAPSGSLKIGNTIPTAVEVEEGDEMRIQYRCATF